MESGYQKEYFRSVSTVDVVITRVDERMHQLQRNQGPPPCIGFLNVVRSGLAQSAFVAYVEICSSSSVISAGPTCIGFYKAAPADMDRAAVAANTDLIIFVPRYLLAE